jgi:hypothetical protein
MQVDKKIKLLVYLRVTFTPVFRLQVWKQHQSRPDGVQNRRSPITRKELILASSVWEILAWKSNKAEGVVLTLVSCLGM